MEQSPTTPQPPPQRARRAGRIACVWGLLLIVLAWLACGCDDLLPGLPPLFANGTTPSPTPTATLSPTAAPSPTALTPGPIPITRTSTITLVLWYPDHLSPVSSAPGGAVLFEQLNSFRQMNPRVRVTGVRRRAYGPGGLLDYLRTTSRVLPGGMPDLVALDLTEVKQAAELGLIQPLDDLLPATLFADLLPLADPATLLDGQRIALPYELGVRFLAYNQVLVGEPPASWADLLGGGASYLLPLADDDIYTADGLLLQYYALGGQIEDEQGQLALDEALLGQALEFYQNASANKVLHTASLTTSTLAEGWALYKRGAAAMVETSARLVLSEPAPIRQTRYASIPTASGQPATLAEGWAWCLVTTAPERQQQALALLSWLMEEDNLTARAQAARTLPARRRALTRSLAGQQWAGFLEPLLDYAYLRPSHALYPDLERLLQAALQEVLLGSSTPEQATQEIMAFVERQRAR